MKAKKYTATDHDFDHNLIDQDALYIINTLQEAGYVAYLVGGGVRDLLAKTNPKDFDISTSARPEEIKRLFRRNCILIGRRFRLAHVRVGHKTFEVSTFRSGENDEELITRDNQWGSPEEDVLRRDFTINGMFYDPTDNTVIDFVGGWDDIHNNTIRTIGDPVVRFRQDPVRMIRLLKFKARFGFSVDPETEKALDICKSEITKSSPARILEELFRMLESGASEPFFRLMTDSGILELLFPSLTYFLQGKHGEKVYTYLACTDKINLSSHRGPLERAVLATGLLFPILEEEIKSQFTDKDIIPHIGDIMMLTSALIKAVVSSTFSHFPRRITSGISFILSTQYRMTPLTGKRHFKPKLVFNKEFPLALTFLKIRSLIDDGLEEPYNAWKQLYLQQVKHSDHEKHHPPPKKKPSQRYPRKRRHEPRT